MDCVVTDHLGRDRGSGGVLRRAPSAFGLIAWFLFPIQVVLVLLHVLPTVAFALQTLLSLEYQRTCTAYDDGSYQVFVATNNGSALLRVHPTDTVSDLKRQLFFRCNWPVECQRILFGRKQLKDNTTFAAAQVTKGATLHLVARLSGGVGNVRALASLAASDESVWKIGTMKEALRAIGVSLDGVVEKEELVALTRDAISKTNLPVSRSLGSHLVLAFS